MAKISLIAVSILMGLCVHSQNEPIVMTINSSEITKSEFLQIYLKNNNDPKYDKESLDEYMELFRKFKLKVAEAERLGYDTIPKLVRELEGYRKQLALPYLIDSTKNKSLVAEAYERTLNEVRASHILIKVSQNATAADTLAAYNKLLELKKRIESGEDFAAVAQGKGGSQDPSVSNNGGDLGFFTAFQMVYPFEDMAYKTEVGSVSDPFRTRFGYHILKVTEKRKARGTIETAHIMVAVDKKANEDLIESSKSKINEIYLLLRNGGDFDDLVSKYSDDPSSKDKNGVLPAFGTGTTTRMVPEFEEAAFSLKNDGDYSEPIRTDFGFHIVKRLSWKEVESFDSMRKALETKVSKDVRSKATQSSFVEKLKKEYAFKDNSKKGLKWFNENLDSSYYIGNFDPSLLKSNKTLFTLDGNNFTEIDFANFLKSNYRGVRREKTEVVVKKQYDKWQKQAILDYEESKLASKYPAFKALITEYHDGILLYEVMSDMVWNKAMKDTVGLQEYYEINKANYIWGNRVDASIFECYSNEIANQAYKLLQNDTIQAETVVSSINKDSELNIRFRSGKFDTNRTSYLKNKDLKVGLNEPYEVDGKYYVLLVNQKLDPSQKEFSESKGAVTSDYQNYLESKWIAELKERHKVTVYDNVLYSIGE